MSRTVHVRDVLANQVLQMNRKLDTMDLLGMVKASDVVTGEQRRAFLDQLLAKGAASSPAQRIAEWVSHGEAASQVIAESTSQEAYDKAMQTIAEHYGLSGDVIRQLIEQEARGGEEQGEEG